MTSSLHLFLQSSSSVLFLAFILQSAFLAQSSIYLQFIGWIHSNIICVWIIFVSKLLSIALIIILLCLHSIQQFIFKPSFLRNMATLCYWGLGLSVLGFFKLTLGELNAFSIGFLEKSDTLMGEDLSLDHNPIQIKDFSTMYSSPNGYFFSLVLLINLIAVRSFSKPKNYKSHTSNDLNFERNSSDRHRRRASIDESDLVQTQRTSMTETYNEFDLYEKELSEQSIENLSQADSSTSNVNSMESLDFFTTIEKLKTNDWVYNLLLTLKDNDLNIEKEIPQVVIFWMMSYRTFKIISNIILVHCAISLYFSGNAFMTDILIAFLASKMYSRFFFRILERPFKYFLRILFTQNDRLKVMKYQLVWYGLAICLLLLSIALCQFRLTFVDPKLLHLFTDKYSSVTGVYHFLPGKFEVFYVSLVFVPIWIVFFLFSANLNPIEETTKNSDRETNVSDINNNIHMNTKIFEEVVRKRIVIEFTSDNLSAKRKIARVLVFCMPPLVLVILNVLLQFLVARAIGQTNFNLINIGVDVLVVYLLVFHWALLTPLILMRSELLLEGDYLWNPKHTYIIKYSTNLDMNRVKKAIDNYSEEYIRELAYPQSKEDIENQLMDLNLFILASPKNNSQKMKLSSLTDKTRSNNFSNKETDNEQNKYVRNNSIMVKYTTFDRENPDMGTQQTPVDDQITGDSGLSSITHDTTISPDTDSVKVDHDKKNVVLNCNFFIAISIISKYNYK